MKLFVGNLSFDTTETELEELFAPFGTVTEATVITDR
ncbi:MAG: RNA-binding protein, partial [Verrucomicrobia bacterium]|nr:RNA-binding protein [Verrucomicrobiota bacterium]